MTSEDELRARFARDVAAARAGDARAAGRARAVAAMRDGHDPGWTDALAEARDVVGEAPPRRPGYEDAVVGGRLRPVGGVLSWAGLALVGAGVLGAVAAAIWG